MTETRQDNLQPNEASRLPLDRLARLWNEFLHVESASGLVLLAATCVALAASNSPLAHPYHDFWQTALGIDIGQLKLRYPLEHWINDGLMTIFFFVVGLEVKRELVLGELRDVRRAMLPIAAAIGGMIVPAIFYIAIERGGPGHAGWGIPMATDIAFVVGCMALLGPRIPHGLRVMLLTLAIVDDIGAILVIAVGYSQGLRWDWLGYAAIGFALIAALRYLGVRQIAVYLVVGVLIWYAVHESGIHATIAGVVLGLMTPTRGFGINEAADGTRSVPATIHAADAVSPLEYLETRLHPWVAFGVMPIFALANAGVELHPRELTSPVAWAVIAGLVVGKPLGVLIASAIAVRLKLAKLPERVNWKMMLAAGSLAGIGFTMALFIAGLALDGPLLETGKVGVLFGSVLSAIAGTTLTMWQPQKSE